MADPLCGPKDHHSLLNGTNILYMDDTNILRRKRGRNPHQDNSRHKSPVPLPVRGVRQARKVEAEEYLYLSLPPQCLCQKNLIIIVIWLL